MTLPAPYYRNEQYGVTLYHGDCLELLPQFPAGAFDAVVTDIPFSEKTHSGARGANDRVGLVSFASIDERKVKELIAEFIRVSVRWVVSFIDWRHILAAEQFQEFVRAGVWTKNDPAPQFTGDRPAHGWEAIAILHPDGRKRWNGGGRPAVWRSNIVKRSPLHDTEKPVSLICQLVEDFTDEGETVADPCCGSGTTAIACLRTGRRCTLIELDGEHCETAMERIRKEIERFPLWESKAKPRQMELIECRPATT